jgi:hypothetical protein
LNQTKLPQNPREFRGGCGQYNDKRLERNQKCSGWEREAAEQKSKGEGKEK